MRSDRNVLSVFLYEVDYRRSEGSPVTRERVLTI